MRGRLLLGVLAVAALIVASAHSLLARAASDRAEAPLVRSRGNISPAELRSFDRFPLLYLGHRFEGMPLVAVHRVDAAPHHGELIREDDVTFIYGACAPAHGNPCMPPLQVQLWNACERHAGSYAVEPEWRGRIRGVQAAAFDGGTRLELYAGRVTVVLFVSAGRRLLDRAAAGLRGLTGPPATLESLARPGGLPTCRGSRE
jgi:hypothetical protein